MAVGWNVPRNIGDPSVFVLLPTTDIVFSDNGQSCADRMPEKPPSYTLYSPLSAALAAFAGTALAGALVIAFNYRRLGQTEMAWRSFIIGLATSMLILTLAMAERVPKFFTGLPMGILQAIALGWLANKLQGRDFSQHVEAGGCRGSFWGVAGIVLLSIVAIIVTGLICFEIRDLAFKHY
jgi:hypothetical protein